MLSALSVRQPWAWLIVNGHKPVENRDWRTRYRGPLLIHASLVWDGPAVRWVRARFPDINIPDDLPCGGIVGRARLADCVDEYPSPWFQGRHGFVLEYPAPMEFIPARGSLGLWVPNAEVMRRVAEVLAVAS